MSKCGETMKILFEGEPKELSEFFCLAVEQCEKSTEDSAEDFWQTLLNGLVEAYKAPLQGREKETSD